MVKTLLKNELRIMFSSYLISLILQFVLFGAYMFFVINYQGYFIQGVKNFGFVDSFMIFAVGAIGISSMFLSISGPHCIIEKTLGILDNLMVYVKKPVKIIIAKALFLTILSFTCFFVWSLVGYIYSAYFSSKFINGTYVYRDLFCGFILYPFFIFVLSFVQVMISYIIPKLANLINMILFFIAFFVFFNVFLIIGKLNGNIYLLILLPIIICFILIILYLIMLNITNEIFLKR